jgi:hypothetical protein
MRFTGMGRDRKYEIRNTKYGIETNFECPTPSAEYRMEVQGTKYKVQSRDSYLDQNFASKGSCLPSGRVHCTWYFVHLLPSCYLILATRYFSNAEHR